MAGSNSSNLASTETSRAFLQERLALFWKLMLVIGALVMVPDFVIALIEGTFQTHTLFNLVNVTVAGGLWFVCRRGVRSIRFSRVAELGGLVVTIICIGVMERHLVPGVSEKIAAASGDVDPAHPIFGAYVSLTVLIGAMLGVVVRAVVIPSPPRWTAALTLALGVPFLLIGVFVAPGTLEWRAWEFPPQLVTQSVVWVFVVIVCTIISSVIYGLRAEIREARQLGQYTLESKLGEGGMGVVYRARHGMMRRATAVKLLRTTDASEVDLRRFEREVQLTARLTHSNTITIFDYGRTDDGVFYYAMELLDGATLDAVVEVGGPLPPGRVSRVLSMAAGALVEAHGIGLIHRDIKPANIMLCSQGGELDVVKVLDFGLVKELDVAGDAGLTAAESILGTPLYMPPEAIESAETLDGRADVYALGAVGYFMVTGEPVFVGKSILEVCSKHLSATPEPPSARLGAHVPEELEQLLLQCLEKNPADRPQSAAEVRARLDGIGVSPWTQADAREWWDRFGEELTPPDSSLELATAETIVVEPTPQKTGALATTQKGRPS